MPLFGLSDVLSEYLSQTNTVNNFPINSAETVLLGNGDPTDSATVSTEQNVAYYGYSIWGLTTITTQNKPPL